MSYTRGYYSLVQYCPDESRAESVNLGVVLFCPDRGFLDLITSPGNDRVRRLFRSDSFDQQRLNDAKHALENRLRREAGTGIRNQEEFARFVESRTNALLLTTPRPLKVVSPAEELRNLYESLVLDPHSAGVSKAVVADASQFGKSHLRQRLNTLFRRPQLLKAQVAKPTVILPVTGTKLTAPYGFQNGRLNLIVPMQFNKSTSERAVELALKGDLLQKHEKDMANPAALWITLPMPENKSRIDEREHIEALFKEYDLPVYREENFDDLARHIEAIIH